MPLKESLMDFPMQEIKTADDLPKSRLLHCILITDKKKKTPQFSVANITFEDGTRTGVIIPDIHDCVLVSKKYVTEEMLDEMKKLRVLD